ncbi:glycine-rich domain-containing protein [Bosea sp. NPDC003192]|uniref:glycine-rich domain-containing protein n=1 Tax=Bosea sp. NPDC003192 TaxID=3390551 RepID=UPI003D0067C0
MNAAAIIIGMVVAVVLLLVAGNALASYKRLRRAEFIRRYPWPRGLLDQLAAHHPGFTRKETALVSEGLRQFFLAYLNSGRREVAMPSQIADDLWHEFILYTRDYGRFCSRAFGRFLHHTPAVALREGAPRDNSALRRVWWQCCRDENIDPVRPTRLPLLFALDSKLKIANGFVYTPDCAALRRNGDRGTQCGGDFSSSSFDGSTDGFGDSGNASDSSSSDGSGSDSGGGDSGGGCGGGGGD